MVLKQLNLDRMKPKRIECYSQKFGRFFIYHFVRSDSCWKNDSDQTSLSIIGGNTGFKKK